MLRILNSQSRQKEEFKPLNAGRVTMYTCGPTVYDSLHLGHARAAITPDVVRRYLEYKGYNVRFVMNFTDVDDKIIKRSIAEKTPYREITSRYIDEFHRLMLSLNVKPADVYPRATDHIDSMIEIVARLIDKKHAYAASDGDVYFDTATYARYGALSGRKLEEEEAGHSGRISQDRMAVKKNSGDFVLWKLNKNDKPEMAAGGDLVPRWPSPWGEGRPGWHLECSAMSRLYLGVPFDIHGGGQDLLFPHHEDEKAQTECAYHEELGDKDSVRYWVHNAFITVDGEKMAKSFRDAEGKPNVKWLREMIWPEGSYDPMAIRMLMLSSHYRSPLEAERQLFDEAVARLERIYNTIEALERVNAAGVAAPNRVEIAQFEAAMDDDFNTAGALGVVFDLVSHANQELAKNVLTPEQIAAALATIRLMLSVLGLRPHRAKAASAGDSEQLVELLMQARLEARTAKQYQLGDKIRNGIKALGYEVEDLPGGKWVVMKK
ncbi:MAG TPA: cysteine--tRNA ligase [Planctomycetota bacterium]|jgi:cysteinyl-tRNA synthetase